VRARAPLSGSGAQRQRAGTRTSCGMQHPHTHRMRARALATGVFMRACVVRRRASAGELRWGSDGQRSHGNPRRRGATRGSASA
jgi:hypothetical protein